MKIAALVALVASAFFAFPADADITIKAYKLAKASGGSNWNTVQIYLTGEGAGYGYANVELRAENKPPFFCVPKELALETANYITIIDAAIERGKFSDDVTADYILLLGLRFTFPCK
jgi:hypothetical protein